MAAERRGQAPLKVDLSAASADLPPISALFLIYFDIKAGYTIGWKRSIPGLELEGVVEYKSLPSGLHTVKEDLIYFVHENHVGLSAFVNAPADEESRNARMIAVGVMVPLTHGRLGRSWKHADKLKEMASKLIIDTTDTKVLEEFWEEHKAEETPTSRERSDSLLDSPSSIRYEPAQPKPKGHGRNHSESDGTALIPAGQNLSTYHPAWSLSNLLETFGPLIFPIYRAALLRKRILITAHAPVEETCNFVYDLSLLSNIPFAVSNLLTVEPPSLRLRPLFSIGVHDIPLLEEDLRASRAAPGTPAATTETGDSEKPGNGWIACTTDSILAMKSTLYDVLITIPPAYSSSASNKVWPKVESPQGIEMKATQRDLRRYKALRWGLSRHASPSSPMQTTEATDLPTTPRATSSAAAREDPMLDIPDTDDIIEPLSWSAVAYSGFMWWASAGEGQRLDADEETENDSLLLSGLSLTPQTPRSPNLTTTNPASSTSPSDITVMAIIAYFHRFTTLIMTSLSDIVDTIDSDDERDSGDTTTDEDDADEQGPAVYVTSGDLVRMGLDVWSASDHAFVEDVVRVYFGRKAQVEGRNVDVCGVRIC